MAALTAQDAMDKATFDVFRDIVYEKSGITLSSKKVALVTARVGKRMRALGIASHREYLDYILRDQTEREFVYLIDAISTNVTSFYREAVHFDFLSKLMTEWLAKGQTRFRLWSAASSTGEEPYTIAITLLEAAKGRNIDMRLLATDISTQVLAKCAEGIYGADKVKPVAPALRDTYFDRVKDAGETKFAAKDVIKRMVTFRRLNLSTPPFPMKGPLDVVFCRNVMIYFDNTVRKGILDETVRLLKPGGYLMVGHSESLTSMMCNLKSVQPSIYMKPLR